MDVIRIAPIYISLANTTLYGLSGNFTFLGYLKEFNLSIDALQICIAPYKFVEEINKSMKIYENAQNDEIMKH